jgi:outer membrane protein assembly factor BamE
MRKLLQSIYLLVALGIVSGCVFQPPMSQGNLLKQEDIDQVEIGMTQSQVRFLLGTPMIDDPFHHDRWDYVYYLKIGRQDATFKRWISIEFENERVTEIIENQELGTDL